MVVQRLLLDELRRKQVPSPESVCEDIATALSGLGTSAPDSPDAVFQRLGGA